MISVEDQVARFWLIGWWTTSTGSYIIYLWIHDEHNPGKNAMHPTEHVIACKLRRRAKASPSRRSNTDSTSRNASHWMLHCQSSKLESINGGKGWWMRSSTHSLLVVVIANKKAITTMVVGFSYCLKAMGRLSSLGLQTIDRFWTQSFSETLSVVTRIVTRVQQLMMGNSRQPWPATIQNAWLTNIHNSFSIHNSWETADVIHSIPYNLSSTLVDLNYLTNHIRWWGYQPGL